MSKIRISFSDGISIVASEQDTQAQNALRFLRVAAVAYASFVVFQTVVFYALDWYL